MDNEKRIKKFIDKYQQIEKIEETVMARQTTLKDPIVSYLKEVNKNKLLPRKMPFQRPPGHEEEDLKSNDSGRPANTLALKSYYLNPGYADAFAKNLKSNGSLTCLILRNTKLTDETFGKIAHNFPHHLKKLDISENPNLTLASYKLMCHMLTERKAKLTHMSFDKNEFGDQSCQEICTFLIKMGSI